MKKLFYFIGFIFVLALVYGGYVFMEKANAPQPEKIQWYDGAYEPTDYFIDIQKIEVPICFDGCEGKG